MAGVPKVILAKKEATYAVDAVPTAAANAILTRNFRITPLEVDQTDRNLDLPSRGRSPSAPTNRRSTRSFEVEAAGSGVAGTAPAWMEILEGCGMVPPVLVANATATQRFAPPGTDGSSLTFYDTHNTNQRRKGLGSRGTFGWNFAAGAYPFWTFNFTSLVPQAAVETASLGQPDFSRYVKPEEVNVENTAIVVGGYAVSCRTFTGEINAEVAIRNLTGERLISRGNHAITGTLSIKCPDLGSKNYWDSLASGALIPFQLVHGTVAGNIVGMATPNLQVLSIAYVEDGDFLLIDIGYALNVVAGQDDLIITAR